MQTFIIQPKYRFGDVVHFDSKAQGFPGKGKVVGITADVQGNIDYMLDIGEALLQPGIYEEEITVLERNEPPEGATKYNLMIETKFALGDRVRYHVPGTSNSMDCSVEGRIFAITVLQDRKIEYIIEIPSVEFGGEYEHLVGGILENQITLLE